jgi:hypothetical protein
MRSLKEYPPHDIYHPFTAVLWEGIEFQREKKMISNEPSTTWTDVEDCTIEKNCVRPRRGFMQSYCRFSAVVGKKYDKRKRTRT